MFIANLNFHHITFIFRLLKLLVSIGKVQFISRILVQRDLNKSQRYLIQHSLITLDLGMSLSNINIKFGFLRVFTLKTVDL